MCATWTDEMVVVVDGGYIWGMSEEEGSNGNDSRCSWISFARRGEIPLGNFYSSLLVDGTTMPKLLSTVSSLCQSGGLYTSTAGVSISTRVDIDESLKLWEKKSI